MDIPKHQKKIECSQTSQNHISGPVPEHPDPQNLDDVLRAKTGSAPTLKTIVECYKRSNVLRMITARTEKISLCYPERFITAEIANFESKIRKICKISLRANLAQPRH